MAIAERITGEAIRAMLEAGLCPQEPAHSLVHAGLDFLARGALSRLPGGRV